MPPKRQTASVARSSGHGFRQQSTATYLYYALSEPENFSVVKSLALFGVCFPSIFPFRVSILFILLPLCGRDRVGEKIEEGVDE